jgi:1,2-diacylglycerol 3-beta-galactosyltransferase
MYGASNHTTVVRGISRALWPYVHHPLQRLFSNHAPTDIIVSFHPVPNALLAHHRRVYAPSMPLAVVIQDFVSAPSAWFVPGHDAYFLPWPETKERALSQGLPASKLHVTGMPVRRAFMQAMETPKHHARAALGIDDHTPMVLFVGGGEGMGDMLPFVKALMVHKPRAQVVAITGHNHLLKQRLIQYCGASNLSVLGFEQEMPLWMRATDILVTKAGPNTLAEAFLMGLPVIMYHAIPGQETGNPTLVEKHGAGIWAPNPQQAAKAALHLLQHQQARLAMAEQAQRLARPRAADAIAQKLWDMW